MPGILLGVPMKSARKRECRVMGKGVGSEARGCILGLPPVSSVTLAFLSPRGDKNSTCFLIPS